MFKRDDNDGGCGCDSLSSWLEELRFQTESYEPQFFRQSIGSELSLLLCQKDKEMHKESPASVYVRLWECSTQTSKINFAEERPVSTVFQECVEQEFTKPVKVEKVEFYLTKDVLDWITNLWYSSEDEDEFEEEILHNCTEYDQKHSNSSGRPKPEKFPTSEDVVELRKTETHVNRRAYANTIHSTSNNSECFTTEGPYKLKGDNKTKLKVENGKVEVKEHTVQFWSNGTLLRSEIIEGKVEKDKHQISYNTKDGVRVVIFKNPINKEDSLVADSRSFLRKFLRRRSDKYLLERKGILKNENVFGNKLTVLKERFGQAVPPFVKIIMALIESDENIKSEYIYRISGNMAVIQKIRLQIDENNIKILDKHEKDVEVLTGTLKLFYRELIDPILPHTDFEKLNKILDKDLNPKERSTQVIEIIEAVESPFKENLKELIAHLLKIEANSSYNKMTLQSLAIVWGPSLIWYQPDKCPTYHPVNFSLLANKVVEMIFTSYKTLFTQKVQPSSEIKNKLEEKVERMISDDGENEGNKMSMASIVGGFFGLRKAESKEVLSGSSWSLSSFGLESKKVNENPYYGYSFDSLPKRENETIPWIISEILNILETKSNVEDLYIKSYSKDYMIKFRKKVCKSKPDISKIEPLDLAIILVKILRELEDKFIPEKIFIDYCDNYERLNSDQRKKLVEQHLENLETDRKHTLEKIMNHLFKVFEHRNNRLPVMNVWLPVFCNTTRISDQALNFTELIFNYFEKKLFPNRQLLEKPPDKLLKPFEFKIKIHNKEGEVKTSFSENSGLPPVKDNVKSSFSNAQLNSIANSLEKNTPGKFKREVTHKKKFF